MRALSELMRNFRQQRGLDLYQLRRSTADRWEEVAGERIASFSSVTGFVHGRIRVAAHHPGIAMEIRSRQTEILKALNRLAGREVFDSISVVRGKRRAAPK
mgnify:CR=1 FL=1